MQTDIIAEFAKSNRYSTLPGTVKERTKLAVLNFFAVAVGANAYPQSRSLVQACNDIQSGNLPVYGSGITAGLLGSTWANSSLSHLLDFDDTHLGSIVHPSAPVIPGALSIATEQSKSGEEVIYSSSIGMETAIRLAIGVGLDERYSDWHNTSLFGTAASGAAASIMLGLDAEKISSSILQGLTVATGFLSNRGTITKSFQVGRAAAEGVISAKASRNGVTVSRNILKTFSASLTAGSNLDLISADIGVKWHLLDNYLKPYPCGVVLHPGIDAAVMLRERNIDYDNIETIEVKVNPIVMVLTAILEPNSGLESKFSVTHAIAAALTYGPLYPEHFSDTAVTDPGVLRVRRKVKVVQDEEINRGQTSINIKYKNGKSEYVDLNRGPEVPSRHLNLEDVHKKFQHLVTPVLGKVRADSVWDYLRNIENKKDLSELKELFR